jgi:holo-[acyl-carrier protein] synthase
MLDLVTLCTDHHQEGGVFMDGGGELLVGTDIESISAVAQSLVEFGARYANRVYTELELTTCGGVSPAAAPRLAARFAAKEAVLKLLNPTELIPTWRSIEIRTATNGAPSVHLSGAAAELAASRRIGPIALSMSHGAGVGLATAIAATRSEPDNAPPPVRSTTVGSSVAVGAAPAVEMETTAPTPDEAIDPSIADRG